MLKYVILGQRFAGKRGNVKSNKNKGFKVIYPVNRSLKGDIKLLKKCKFFENFAIWCF